MLNNNQVCKIFKYMCSNTALVQNKSSIKKLTTKLKTSAIIHFYINNLHKNIFLKVLQGVDKQWLAKIK